ncbi:DUF4919 domain-containing protein [Flammeovirgaceae bacterium SG7u.111]|nr:DUF4919 domain-containing protein [Flammeovirgaceae bacterium SG7u.111]
MKGIIFIPLFFIGLISPLMGQTDDALFLKAKGLYDKNNYREALYHLKKYISIDNSNAEAYKMRGNCYLEFNQLDSAENDYYTALQLDSTLTEVNYNLGLLYESRSQIDSAMIFYYRFMETNPKDADVYLKLGTIYDERMIQDSSRILFEQAYSLDSLNPEPHYYLCWNYYLSDEWDTALKWTKSGKELDANNTGFYLVAGLCHYTQMNFKKSVEEFEKALTIDEQPSIYVLKARSEVFMDTDTSLIRQGEDYSFQFVHVNSKLTETLDTWVKDSTHQYSFDSLWGQFVDPVDGFGIDKYFMFYYGTSTLDGYSPYSLNENPLPTLLKEGKYKEAAEAGERIALRNPSDFKNFGLLSVAYLNLGDTEKFYDNVLKYEGFVNGILATGSGESYGDAQIVIKPSDEYEVISYLGHSSQSQSLNFHEGHIFDILKTIDEYGNERDFFFNIDKPYKQLSESVGGKKKKKKRGKKKKSKKKD